VGFKLILLRIRRMSTYRDVRRFKALCAFDGTDFQGWQSQPEGNTVQDIIEGRLRAYLRRPVRIYSSGRTDAGVHAQGLVYHFELFDSELRRDLVASKKEQKRKGKHAASITDGFASSTAPAAQPIRQPGTFLSADSPECQRLLNVLQRCGNFPVVTYHIEEVPANFDARSSCTGKRYVYNIVDGVALPFQSRWCWNLRTVDSNKRLDIVAMRKAAALMVGIHNFRAFCVIEENDERSPIRKLWRLSVYSTQSTSPICYCSKCTLKEEDTRFSISSLPHMAAPSADANGAFHTSPQSGNACTSHDTEQECKQPATLSEKTKVISDTLLKSLGDRQPTEGIVRDISNFAASAEAPTSKQRFLCRRQATGSCPGNPGAAGSSTQQMFNIAAMTVAIPTYAPVVTVVAECDRYLYKMMRMLVGTLVEVGRGKLSPEQVRGLLQAGEPSPKVNTAPPEGLVLDEVFYD